MMGPPIPRDPGDLPVADGEIPEERPRDVCPTCGGSEWERAGEDVARCRTCGYLWILPPDPP